jgi:hypothetical protein
VPEGEFVAFQKGLLGGAQVGSVESAATRHRAHAENLKLGEIPRQVGIGFVPVHLGFAAPTVGLRHIGFLDQQPKRPFPVVNVIAYRRFRDRVARHLRQDAAINPTCRMPLLARSLPVRLKNAVDEPFDRSQHRLGSLAVCANGRKRAVHRLTHEPAVDSKLPSDTLDRADPEFILAAQLLE